MFYSKLGHTITTQKSSGHKTLTFFLMMYKNSLQILGNKSAKLGWCRISSINSSLQLKNRDVCSWLPFQHVRDVPTEPWLLEGNHFAWIWRVFTSISIFAEFLGCFLPIIKGAIHVKRIYVYVVATHWPNNLSVFWDFLYQNMWMLWVFNAHPYLWLYLWVYFLPHMEGELSFTELNSRLRKSTAQTKHRTSIRIYTPEI